MKFDFRDYYRMFHSKGVKLPICYFINNHLFDILNNTNTHTWLPKKHYKTKPQRFKYGVLYMSSWTNIIKKTTDFLFRTQLDNTKKYQLIDIGSGKGKVLCVWSKMFHKKKNVSLLGVEYSQELNNICINNLKKMPYVNYKISNEDALEVNFIKDNYINIFYLYNPFSEKVLNKFIRKIKCYFCYVIYVNPAHEKLFIQNNFSILLKKNAWHPNASYTIFKYEKNNEE